MVRRRYVSMGVSPEFFDECERFRRELEKKNRLKVTQAMATKQLVVGGHLKINTHKLNLLKNEKLIKRKKR